MKHHQWQELCNNNPILISYLMSTVVHDEFNPRLPDAEDIQIALLQLKNELQTPKGADTISSFLISSPDKLNL